MNCQNSVFAFITIHSFLLHFNKIMFINIDMWVTCGLHLFHLCSSLALWIIVLAGPCRYLMPHTGFFVCGSSGNHYQPRPQFLGVRSKNCAVICPSSSLVLELPPLLFHCPLHVTLIQCSLLGDPLFFPVFFFIISSYRLTSENLELQITDERGHAVLVFPWLSYLTQNKFFWDNPFTVNFMI